MLTNGTFDTDYSGWTAGLDTALSVVNGRLRVTRMSQSVGYAYQTIETVFGKTYNVSVDAFQGTESSRRLRVGTTEAGFQLGQVIHTGAPDKTAEISFNGTGSTVYVTLYITALASGRYAEFDNATASCVNCNDNPSPFSRIFNKGGSLPISTQKPTKRVEYSTPLKPNKTKIDFATGRTS